MNHLFANPAPVPGSGSPGTSMSAIASFIKHHYPEIILVVLAIYLLYVLIMEVSKFVFKPAFLVDHHRGTKRYIGRTLHSKVVLSEDPTLGAHNIQEFRAFIKDGLFRPIIPHLFIDMDRVKVGSNYILLDYRAVVYDHGRRMFVGSLTGAKDIDLDGEAVNVRTKDKLSMIDIYVSMSVKGCANVAQFNYLNNAIPIGDGIYEEKKEPRMLRGEAGLPPDVMDPESHIDDVLEAKAMKEELAKRPVKRRRFTVRGHPPGSNRMKRFTVGSPDEGEEEESEEPEEEPTKAPPTEEIVESETEQPDFDSMSLGKKFKNIFTPKLDENLDEDQPPEEEHKENTEEDIDDDER